MRKFTFLMLSVVFMVLGMYAQDEVQQELLIIGNAVQEKWDPSPDNGAQVMEYREVDGVFVWTGTVKGLNEPDNDGGTIGFRFTLSAGNWWPGFSPADGYTTCEDGKEYKIAKHDSDPAGDPRFQVAETGTYTICVNIDYMRMTCVKGTEPVYPQEAPVINKDALFLVGSALNEDGNATWNHDRMVTLEGMEDGVFMWEGDFYVHADGTPSEFKFKTLADSWDGTVVSAVEGQVIKAMSTEEAEGQNESGEGEEVGEPGIYDMVYRPFEHSANDWTFKVEQSGTYVLTIDLNDMVLLVKDFTPTDGSAVEEVQEDMVIVSSNNRTITLLAKGSNNIQSAVLFDIAGKRVASTAIGGNTIVLGENLNNGLYIVKTTCAGKDYIQKVMVK